MPAELLKEALWAALLAFQVSTTEEQREAAARRFANLLNALLQGGAPCETRS